MKGTRRDDFVEHVCDLLASDTLYFKVDDGNRADYEALGHGPFKPFDGKGMVMSYYEVPAEVMDRRERFTQWAAEAIDAARRAAQRRPQRSKARKAQSLAPSRRSTRKRVR